MYLLLPKNFLVSVQYISKENLGIKEYNSINKYFLSRQGMIGVSLPSEIAKRWAIDGKIMEEEADLLGIPIRVKIADDNEVNQEIQIKELILEGARILIIAPINSSRLEPVIQSAKGSGIIVIAYDRLILNIDIDAYVSFSSLRVGQLQGRYLIEKVPEGNYVIISGDPNDNNSMLLKKGAMEYIHPRVLQRYINIVQDASALSWNPEVAYNIVRDTLQVTNNKIDAILAPNDETAGGVIKALEEKGLAGKVQVTGQDSSLEAAKRIVNGTQGMTIFKDARELGKEAIDIAVKLARGEALDAGYIINNGKFDIPSILLTPVLVDKNNIDRVLIASGYMNKNDIYVRNIFVK